MSKRRAVPAVLAAPFAAFAAVELGFRLFVAQDALVYRDSELPELGFELRPGASGVKSGAPVSINAAGFRERELPLEKPRDEYRVVVVGDHATFGLGVKEEDAYVRRLESLVKPPAGKKLVVINASNYQYSLDQKLALLKSRALAYEPDLVVFQVTTQAGYKMNPPMFPFVRLKNFVRERSAFVRWAIERYYWSRKPPPDAPADPAKPGPTEYDGIALSLGSLRESARKAGAQAMVVYVPNLKWNEPEADVSTAAGLYRKASAKLGLPFVDVTPALKGDPKRYLLTPGGNWLNPEGHGAAAKKIAPELQKQVRRRTRPSA